MNLYNRYIFNKTLAGFAGFITVLIALIWFSRAITFVKYVTENGVELSQFFYLFILILPWLLLFIVPVSLFAAILMTYNQLINCNEITILKNSGLTKAKIARPIASIAIITSIFCFITAFYFMPYANRELRLSRIDFQNNYSNISFNPQTFETLRDLTIYAKKRDDQNHLFGILLHDKRSPKYSITITAGSGNIVTKDDSALLYMKNGTLQKLNYVDNKTEILNFDDYVFNLTESNKKSGSFHWKAKERYIDELLNPEESSSEEDLAGYRAEINQRLIYPLLPIIFSIIASACILRGSFKRHGNVSNIILATALAVTFLFSTIICCDLIETSSNFVPLLYVDFITFFFIGIKLLSEKKLQKK